MIQTGKASPIKLFKPGNALLCKFHHNDFLPVRQQPLEMTLRHDFSMRLKQRWFALKMENTSSFDIFSKLSHFVINLFQSHPIVDQVLNEVQKGYDLLILEIETACKDFAFPHLDSIIRLAPCPTITIFNSDLFMSYPSKNLLVYLDDSRASNCAFEVATVLSSGNASPPIALSTIHTHSYGIKSQTHHRARKTAEKMARIRQLEKTYGINLNSEITVSDTPEQTIMDIVQTTNIGTVVLGSNIQAGSTTKYLSPMINRLTRQDAFQLIVVNSFE